MNKPEEIEPAMAELVTQQIEGGGESGYELFVGRFPQAIYEFRILFGGSDQEGVVRVSDIVPPDLGGRVAEIESVDDASVAVRLSDKDNKGPDVTVAYLGGALSITVGGESSLVEPGSEGIRTGLTILSTLQLAMFNHINE